MVKGLLPQESENFFKQGTSRFSNWITDHDNSKATEKKSVTSSCHFDLDSDELQKEIGQLFSLIV